MKKSRLPVEVDVIRLPQAFPNVLKAPLRLILSVVLKIA